MLFSPRKEISKILRSSYLRGMNLASFFVASKIIVFVTFTTYVFLGNVITASRVFVAVSLYGAVRLTVTLFFPSAVEKVSEAFVSIRRIKVCWHINLLCCRWILCLFFFFFLPLFIWCQCVPVSWGLVFLVPRLAVIPKCLSTPLPSDTAAAATKSLHSCPTLCDPIDRSPWDSSVPGILQARILEWVAI